MLDAYFAKAGRIAPDNAWAHVYRLLLWIDRTTGLAHCYESDKAQPGRAWYARSLAFHDWTSAALGSTPDQLVDEIDWLFREGTRRSAAVTAQTEKERRAAAEQQRRPYEGRGFPVPGTNPELEALILEEVGSPASQISEERLAALVRRLNSYFGLENKRKNLVGEGFEDTLAYVMRRLPGGTELDIRTRPLLHDIPGFRPPPRGEKVRKVDLAVIKQDGYRILLTVKWSIRADREEQFGIDWEAYARLEEAGEDFGFVLITNEFDAARLAAACDRRRMAAPLFDAVVHVNPEAPLAAYGEERRRSASRLDDLAKTKRLVSLEAWLTELRG